MTWTCVTLVFKYVCGLVYDAYFGNITSWRNTDFVAKESTPKSAQKNAKIASQASKMMNTGAEGARKNWGLEDPKSKNFQDFQLLKSKKHLITTPPLPKRDFRRHFAPEGGGLLIRILVM